MKIGKDWLKQCKGDALYFILFYFKREERTGNIAGKKKNPFRTVIKQFKSPKKILTDISAGVPVQHWSCSWNLTRGGIKKNQEQHCRCQPGTGCLRSRSLSASLCVSETVDQPRCQITKGISYFWFSVLWACRGAVALHCIPIISLNAPVTRNLESLWQQQNSKQLPEICNRSFHIFPHTTFAVFLTSVDFSTTT